MRTGVRLGIDVGKSRIGVARCDAHGMLAIPVETIARDHQARTDISRIMQIIHEYDVFETVVGLPLNMRGEHTLSTQDAETFARQLACRVKADRVSVRMVDERLTTVSAQGLLRDAGRDVKQSRVVIDQASAVLILQHALDIERSMGEPAGSEVVCETFGDTDHG